jgi:hypothetical protein
MEQDQEVRDPEQAEAWVEAVVGEVKAVVAVDGQVGLQQAPGGIASALTVVKEPPINWGPPAMIRNALSVGRP